MRGGPTTKMLDHALMALADPTRRAMLKRLARGEARVTALARPFSVSLNSISKHIKLLERAGLVQRRKVGREHILRFRPEPLSRVQKDGARVAARSNLHPKGSPSETGRAGRSDSALGSIVSGQGYRYGGGGEADREGNQPPSPSELRTAQPVIFLRMRMYW